MFKMMKKNGSVFQRLSDGFIEALAFLWKHFAKKWMAMWRDRLSGEGQQYFLLVEPCLPPCRVAEAALGSAVHGDFSVWNFLLSLGSYHRL